MRDWTLTSLAVHWGLPESACRIALKQPYWAAEMAIAEVIGESPRTLWPHRYDDSGQPINPRKSKLNRHRAIAHRQKEEAA